MKKTLFAIACAAICAFAVSSCELEGLLDELLGEAHVSLTNATDQTTFASPDNDASLNFSSSVADIITSQVEIEGRSISHDNLLFVAANINLTEETTVIPYPIMGFKLDGTTSGTYNIDNIVTAQNLAIFIFGDIITEASDVNLVVVAATDTSWYLGVSGSVTIDAVPDYGHLIEGTLDNVVTYFICQYQLSAIAELYRRAVEENDPEAITLVNSLNFDTMFPHVTLNGTFESRRMNIQSLVTTLQGMEPVAK